MENVVDTLMNILIFVFIGLMIWLYAKKDPGPDDRQEESNRPE